MPLIEILPIFQLLHLVIANEKLMNLAEREGFEPSVEVSPHTRLAGERLQPTRPSLRVTIDLAEGVGFEPTELSLNGFQDRRLKPLGHPSLTRSKHLSFFIYVVNNFY
jgi:hypothetical protein